MNTLPKAPPVVLAQAQALGLGSGTAAALEDLITLAARWRAEAGTSVTGSAMFGAVYAIASAASAAGDRDLAAAITDSDDAVRRAIADRQPAADRAEVAAAYAADALHPLVERWHQAGRSKRAIHDAIAWFALAEDDPHDRLGGLLDALTGYCAPPYRLWPDEPL